MYALRNLARSAPRSAARFSTKAIRPQPSLLRTAAFQPSWSQSAPRLAASFHISAVRKQDSEGIYAMRLVPNHLANATSVKEELVAKLQNEITLEEDMKDDDDLSANIQEYLDNSAFKVPVVSPLYLTLL
jgi:complement component 1 Q subcomponent-binding protein, mitochondrial